MLSLIVGGVTLSAEREYMTHLLELIVCLLSLFVFYCEYLFVHHHPYYYSPLLIVVSSVLLSLITYRLGRAVFQNHIIEWFGYSISFGKTFALILGDSALDCFHFTLFSAIFIAVFTITKSPSPNQGRLYFAFGATIIFATKNTAIAHIVSKVFDIQPTTPTLLFTAYLVALILWTILLTYTHYREHFYMKRLTTLFVMCVGSFVVIQPQIPKFFNYTSAVIDLFDENDSIQLVSEMGSTVSIISQWLLFGSFTLLLLSFASKTASIERFGIRELRVNALSICLVALTLSIAEKFSIPIDQTIQLCFSLLPLIRIGHFTLIEQSFNKLRSIISLFAYVGFAAVLIASGILSKQLLSLYFSLVFYTLTSFFAVCSIHLHREWQSYILNNLKKTIEKPELSHTQMLMRQQSSFVNDIMLLVTMTCLFILNSLFARNNMTITLIFISCLCVFATLEHSLISHPSSSMIQTEVFSNRYRALFSTIFITLSIHSFVSIIGVSLSDTFFSYALTILSIIFNAPIIFKSDSIGLKYRPSIALFACFILIFSFQIFRIFNWLTSTVSLNQTIITAVTAFIILFKWNIQTQIRQLANKII